MTESEIVLLNQKISSVTIKNGAVLINLNEQLTDGEMQSIKDSLYLKQFDKKKEYAKLTTDADKHDFLASEGGFK